MALLGFILYLIVLSSATTAQHDCPSTPLCDTTQYRQLDGSCNNPLQPLWGSPYRPYMRQVVANYADCISEPALSQSGAPLPNARKLSLELFGETEIQHQRNTLISMQFGQFIAHDMSFTADAGGIECCSDGKMVPKELASSRCFPIEVAADDPVMAEEGIECINVVRTKTTLEDPCAPQGGHAAEQLTAVTAYLDLSVVYGNSIDHSHKLRVFSGGQLSVEARHGKHWPPRHPNGTTTCSVDEDTTEVCYMTGDVRSNQSPHLTLLHLAFHLEHNRLANELANLNAAWTDEQLFQEARRINIAQFQAIVYNEWLPIYLGRESMIAAGVLPALETPDHVRDYDPNVDPTVSNAFATSAFRFYHNLIAGHLNLVTESTQPTGSIRLSDWFDKPAVLEMDGNYEALSRGMVTQPHDRPNIHFTPEVKHFLFRHGAPIGVDLKAIDIQRARDHGLATYNEYRSFCGLRRMASWEEFGDLLRPASAELLPEYYESVDDVELTIAAAMERHLGDGMIGETFGCILLDQFRRTRAGDRFFYENGNTFTVRQLHELRKASMARVLCDNTVGLKEIQQRPFFLVSDDNPVMPCERIPTINLIRWRSIDDESSN